MVRGQGHRSVHMTGLDSSLARSLRPEWRCTRHVTLDSMCVCNISSCECMMDAMSACKLINFPSAAYHSPFS